MDPGGPVLDGWERINEIDQSCVVEPGLNHRLLSSRGPSTRLSGRLPTSPSHPHHSLLEPQLGQATNSLSKLLLLTSRAGLEETQKPCE